MRLPSFERCSLLLAFSLMAAASHSAAADLESTRGGRQPAGRATVAGVTSPMDAATTSFTDVGAGLQGVRNSSVAWGDYDNDGDLDILLTGFISPLSISRLYRNGGGATPAFSDVGAGLENVQSSSVAWGDYDNDGDLDILLTGFGASGPVTKLYRNGGGANPTFSDVGAGLVNVNSSSEAWGDYDNDGDLDILLTGTDVNFVATTRLYRNSGGANPTFSDVGAALDNVQQSSVAWADYDNDGDLDILLTGFTASGQPPIAKLYRNSGGATPTFSDAGAGLTGVYMSSVAWGDYDNDGDLDILLTGFTGSQRIARLYRNSGGPNPTFSNDGATLDGVNTSSVAWGDYDNDGDLDILLTGFTGTARISKLYQSSGGATPTFSDAGAGLANVQSSSVAWGDYDNDGDLDILLTGYDTGNIPISKLYRSDGSAPNTPPNAPGGLSATTGPSGTTFNWSAASDAQTPAAALTYNVRVGTTPGGNEISSAMAAVGGYRRVVRLGNAQERLSWTLRLPPGLYYWSVQAVDGAFMGSAFATEASVCLQAFTDIGAGIAGVAGSSVAWGDYDNDGDLDILLTGSGSSVRTSTLYRNSGGANPTFTDVGAGLTPVDDSSVAWGDYDNDGNLDILLTGEDVNLVPVTQLYRNSGGANPTFSDVGAALPGVYLSSVAWGDYDNDGDLDILITGLDGTARISKLYRNGGGANPTFSEVAGIALTTVSQSSVAWGDYDNDGDLDILLTGGLDVALPRIAQVYRNSGGANPTFTDVGAGLIGVSSSSAAWGDYDNDGDLDILMAGNTTPFDAQPRTLLYQNSGGPNPTFNEHFLSGLNTGVYWCSLAWGDYDNDGDLDILLTGRDMASASVSRLYRNGGPPNYSFSDVGAGLTPVDDSSVAWGDYDNDGDLDILLTGSGHSKLYRNISCIPNTSPTAPSGLTATSGPSGMTFSWNPASDAQTPTAGLSYNLRVGTTPDGNEISSAMAAADGYRRVAQLGNAQERTSWTLAIPPGPYYWSVQALDGAFQGSSFASATVAVGETPELPTSFDLGLPVPNPFASEVALSFALPRNGLVEIAVFDPAGRRLRVLEQGGRPAGRHRVVWDGRDEVGGKLGNGIYLVRMKAAEHVWTRKLVLAR